MVKTLHVQCRGHGFDSWLGNYAPTWCAAKTIFLNVKNLKFKFNKKCGLEISGFFHLQLKKYIYLHFVCFHILEHNKLQ